MAQNEFPFSFAEDSARGSRLCASCGQAADFYLAFFEETPQRSGSFCLSCGEALMRDLLHQRAASKHPHYAQPETAHPVLLATSVHHDETEGGIVFWEGHGWSSDGPFAGA